MRFTSLVVELIRARPRLVVWLVVLLQAAMWLILPLLLYRSPPGDLATVLAFGREYQVGTDLGPPLAFWLADIAFRAAGNHMFGVYLLAQICAVVTFWTLYHAGARHRRRPAGGARGAADHDGRWRSARPASNSARWCWRVRSGRCCCCIPGRLIGQSRRNAWFAWSIEAGLLLLTTSAAIGLLLLIVGICACHRARPAHADVARSALCAARDRRAGAALSDLADPRRRAARCRPGRQVDDLGARALHWGGLLGGLVLAMAGIVLLVVLNSGLVRPQRRGSADHLPAAGRSAGARIRLFLRHRARRCGGSLIAGLFNLDRVVGGAGVALLMSGLAVIVATGDLIYLRRQRLLRTVWAAALVAPALAAIATTLFLPWTGSAEVPTSLPATRDRAFLRRQL